MRERTEAIADRALLRVLDDDRPLGTAFAIAPGWAITCHHVIDGHDQITLEAVSGSRQRVDDSRIIPHRNLDLALVAADIGEAPPIGVSAPDFVGFFAKGYQFREAGATAAVPVKGTVTGSTSVRYSGARREYEVDDVWTLSEATIDHGLSGSPILDREWGVGLGIVNTRFHGEGGVAGFALPLGRAAERWPKLAEALSTNTRAAFGPYLNGAAATAICERSVDATFQELADSGLVLVDRYRPRESVVECMRAFLSTGEPVLPVVAPTGVGKTNELANLARTLAGPGWSCLLIRAQKMAPSSSGLDEAVGETLSRTVKSLLPSEDSTRLLMQALASAGRRLVILVDGLNEAPPELRGVWRTWFPRSLGWLKLHGAKLVFSLRPELWHDVQSILPNTAVGRGRKREEDSADVPRDASGAMQLADFSEAEAGALIDAYDLRGSQLRPADVRHPLDARTYWEHGLGRGAKRLSRLDLLDLLVSTRRDHVALSLDRAAAVGVDIVLADVASRMGPGRELTLARADFNDLHRQYPAVVAALVNESVLQATSSGYRFAFDGMAEILQAQQLEPADITSEAGLQDLAAGEGPDPSIAALALLRLEEDGLGPALNSVLDAWEESPSFELEMLFVRCVTQAGNQRRLMSQSKRYLGSRVHDRGLRYWVGEFVTEMDLPIAQRLDLLRVAVRHEHGFEWEWHHWRLEAPHTRTGVSRRLAQTVWESPVVAFRGLADWLGDGGRLRETATVADVAMGLMWWYAGQAFDELLEVLADHPTQPTSFLWKLAERWPDRLIDVCERWLGGPNVDRHDLAMLIARGVLARGGRVEDEASTRAIALMRRGLARSPSKRAKREALGGLIAADKASPTILRGALRKYEAGNLDLSVIAPGLRTDFDQVFPSIVKRAGLTEPGLDALYLLSRHEARDATEFRSIVEAVEEVVLPGTELNSKVGLIVENLFYRISIAPELTDRLIELARRVIRFPVDDAWRPLTYFAIGHASSRAEKAASRKLFDLLLRDTPTAAMVQVLIGRLPSSGDHKREIRALLGQTVIARVEVEEMLLHQAIGSLELGEVLAEIFGEAGYEPGETARHFLELCASSADAGEAALQALQWRYGM